jgi:hypothetical protein
MSAQKFIHAVAGIFQSDEERIKRQREGIAAEERQIEARRIVATRAANHRDRIMEEKRRVAQLAVTVDRCANFPVEKLFEPFAGGHITIEELGSRIGAVEAVARHAGDLKEFLHRFYVAPAVERSRQYEKENAALLAGVELVESDEPPYTPPVPSGYKFSPPTESSNELLRSLGIVPGEQKPTT